MMAVAARNWLRNGLKQGIQATLAIGTRVASSGQRLAESWDDLVAEARSEWEAEHAVRRANAGRNGSPSEATDRLEKAARQRSTGDGERAGRQATGGAAGSTARSGANRPSVESGADQEATDRLEQAAEKRRRSRSATSGVLKPDQGDPGVEAGRGRPPGSVA
jgi:hypothetical protein